MTYVDPKLEAEAQSPEPNSRERKRLIRRDRIVGDSLGPSAFARDIKYNPIDQLRSMGCEYD